MDRLQLTLGVQLVLGVTLVGGRLRDGEPLLRRRERH
jgi:hypothetical protein